MKQNKNHELTKSESESDAMRQRVRIFYGTVKVGHVYFTET